MPLTLDPFDVLDLALLGCVRLSWRKACVNDLELESLRLFPRREDRREQVTAGVTAKLSGSVNCDVIGVVIALIDDDRHTCSPVRARGVEYQTAGEGAAEGPVVILSKARLLKADDVCFLEE
jgi:hypothetical protein